ncbi:pyridoxamine 5'-phosphate oxidase family protein [Gelatiniphilus marinus]|uniref:Pyridoxamine 5'-phosphate oxidase family protein n=1 Tax=Gelatiniphilus marinus TaxID=1759464 RepID=A0ABW5JND4_9FLAO
MKLTAEIKKYIDKSVLCWLATASKDNVPNVSPKEIFSYYKTNNIIIANIASPQTVKNIRQNKEVCISFIDVLVQKGFQLKGKAQVLEKTNPEFEEMNVILQKLANGKFPFATITKISIEKYKPIIAPKYLLYPETTEKEQIKSAKKLYSL